MKSLPAYKDLTMNLGLIPTIACMVLCIFFRDADVLYIGSLASFIYILHRLVKPPLSRPNIVLVHGTLALFIASIVKGLSGDTLIPDHTAPITLEILILCFSLCYILMPGFYNKLFSYFRLQIPGTNLWAMRVIVALSGIHLLISCIIYLFFNPLSPTALYVMTIILPPVICLACILLNYHIARLFIACYIQMPFLRIAPICNGKIYVAPRPSQAKEANKLDIPMEEIVFCPQANANSYADNLKSRHSDHITGCPELRFSLKYLSNKMDSTETTVFLYILPLKDENQIHFAGGRFVTPEDIKKKPILYSSFLKEEMEHLDMVAKTWQERQ